MRSIVYHQFRKELHIIKTQFCISSLRKLFWYTLKRDDMQSWRTDEIQQWQFCHCWWYTIAFAMDKKIPVLKNRDFWAVRLILEPCVIIYKELKKQKHLEYISYLNNYFTWIKSPSLSATSPSNVFSPISDMYKIILLSSPSYSSVTYLIFKYWPLCVTTPPWDALIL